jgi:hypothetical protein
VGITLSIEKPPPLSDTTHPEIHTSHTVGITISIEKPPPLSDTTHPEIHTSLCGVEI